MKEGRIRFNTVFDSDKVPSIPKIVELEEWCTKFQKNRLFPVVEGNYTGNLSFRYREGFIVTVSGLESKENLTGEDFVYVKRYEEQSNTFVVEGKRKPSSESVTHHMIYRTFEEVNAVFHGHNDLIVANAKKLKLPVTEQEYESGTTELAKEVLKVLGKSKLVVLRNHGFVSVAATMKEAGILALATLNEAKCERARQQSGFSC